MQTTEIEREKQAVCREKFPLWNKKYTRPRTQWLSDNGKVIIIHDNNKKKKKWTVVVGQNWEKKMQANISLTWFKLLDVFGSRNDQLSCCLRVFFWAFWCGLGYVGKSFSLHKTDASNSCFISPFHVYKMRWLIIFSPICNRTSNKNVAQIAHCQRSTHTTHTKSRFWPIGWIVVECTTECECLLAMILVVETVSLPCFSRYDVGRSFSVCWSANKSIRI